MHSQQSSFNARLERIKNPSNIAWTDPETGINVPRRLSRKAINEAKRNVKKVTAFAMLVSFALGLLCVMAVRFVRFNFAAMDLSNTSPDMLMGADMVGAFIAAVVIGSIIGHGKGKHQVAQVVGIVVMTVSMHNLVWAFPDHAEQVYGPAFVAEVLAETRPNSIVLRGQIISL